MMDSEKELVQCSDPREYRSTSLEDIRLSKADKKRGGGPRVGAFQECIPGNGWMALPKYDFSTQCRSSAFNERMHVEWENHVDHILANRGQLPAVSVVAKAGFRSCAPCCRDMLALARPTGKSFIMVDLAEDDTRGTFHFVSGSSYLPVPKEACSAEEVRALKRVVSAAQAGRLITEAQLREAVFEVGAPVDRTAQALYLGDAALLPSGSAVGLAGAALLDVLHAEHFARLAAEYGASILRDRRRSAFQQRAIQACRSKAAQMLVAAWKPHLTPGFDVEAYAERAVQPLLPDDPRAYQQLRQAIMLPCALACDRPGGRSTDRRWTLRPRPGAVRTTPPFATEAPCEDEDADSVAAASTTVPDDAACGSLEDDGDSTDLEQWSSDVAP